jgi:hypothetical protein
MIGGFRLGGFGQDKNGDGMSKKMYAVFAPLIATMVFVIMPAIAQAAPHWYGCEASASGAFKDAFCSKAAPPAAFEWRRVPEGKSGQVPTKGVLGLNFSGVVLGCKVAGKGKIENPAGGASGIDSLSELIFSECTSSNTSLCSVPTVIVLHGGKKLGATNPLPSMLVEVAGVIRDEIRETELEIRCNGVLVALYNKGVLTPKVGSSVLEFGPGSGGLESTSGAKVTFDGILELEGPASAKGITAKNP